MALRGFFWRLWNNPILKDVDEIRLSVGNLTESNNRFLSDQGSRISVLEENQNMLLERTSTHSSAILSLQNVIKSLQEDGIRKEGIVKGNVVSLTEPVNFLASSGQDSSKHVSEESPLTESSRVEKKKKGRPKKVKPEIEISDNEIEELVDVEEANKNGDSA